MTSAVQRVVDWSSCEGGMRSACRASVCSEQVELDICRSQDATQVWSPF